VPEAEVTGGPDGSSATSGPENGSSGSPSSDLPGEAPMDPLSSDPATAQGSGGTLGPVASVGATVGSIVEPGEGIDTEAHGGAVPTVDGSTVSRVGDVAEGTGTSTAEGETANDPFAPVVPMGSGSSAVAEPVAPVSPSPRDTSDDQQPSDVLGSQNEGDPFAQEDAAHQPGVPERGTPEFSRFAQKAYASRFSETEDIRSLWQEAAAGQPNNRSGFDRARDNFWAAVRDEENPRADTVRGILEEAGIDLSGRGAPSLEMGRDPHEDERLLGEFKEGSADRAIDDPTVARMRDLPDDRREYRLSAIAAVDIDHAMPASVAAHNGDPTKWLDPSNLQFMFGDDNRWFKGAKVFPSATATPKPVPEPGEGG
jgi:hypothetical protein